VRFFYSNDHRGHWPVGACTIAIADTKEQAREFISEVLKQQGLDDDDFTVKEALGPGALTLLDGDY
jgi:hypothetical protein